MLLVKFMYERNRVLNDHGIFGYMDKDVEQDILKWSDKESSQIYFTISYVIRDMQAYGFSAYTCPYCRKYEETCYLNPGNCFFTCFYAKDERCKAVMDKIKNCLNINKIFSNKVLNEILNKIEGSENETQISIKEKSCS